MVPDKWQESLIWIEFKLNHYKEQGYMDSAEKYSYDL